MSIICLLVQFSFKSAAETGECKGQVVFLHRDSARCLVRAFYYFIKFPVHSYFLH